MYTVDDLASVVQSGLENRHAAVAQAEAIIETRVQSFMHWVDGRHVVPVIQDLHESGEQVRQHELERARKMLARGDDIEAGFGSPCPKALPQNSCTAPNKPCIKPMAKNARI